jgi:hypothetical protein
MALSVRELARKAGVSYSNAHRELMRMKEVGLLRTKVVGSALLCAWELRDPAARKLTALLETPGQKEVTDEAIYWNLKVRGAGLAREAESTHHLTLEETLAYGLELARRDPDVAQVWPVVLAKNRDQLDLGRLELLGGRLGQKRALGFLLSLTGTLLNDSKLLDYAWKLRDSRVRRMQDFFKLARGERAQVLAEANTPDLARSWFFRMNTSIASFQSHFDKFVKRT